MADMNTEDIIIPEETTEETAPAAEEATTAESGEGRASEEQAEKAEKTEKGENGAQDAEIGGEYVPAEETPAPAENAEKEAVPAPFSLGVQWEGTTRTLSEREATEYAEKGMRYEQLTPTLEKLQLMAAGYDKGLEEMVDELLAGHDAARLQQLTAEADGNEEIARRLLKAEQAERKHAFEQRQRAAAGEAQSQRDALTQRLAGEFSEMKEEFPDIREFKDIPQSVVNTAIRQGIHLMDAYGRYERAERRRTQAAADTAARAAKSSIGSQRDIPPTGESDPLLTALERGLSAGLS